MLRRLRLFPACARKREWPCCQFSDMVLISRRPGDDTWRFREACPDVLRAGSNPSHVWSEKQARVQWMNAATARGVCGRFVRFGRSRGQHEKRAPANRRGPVHCGSRREPAPLFPEVPPKHVNWRQSLRMVWVLYVLGSNRFHFVRMSLTGKDRMPPPPPETTRRDNPRK
jgi:hypothetical protein